MQSLFALAALAAGGGLAVQAGANAQLSKASGGPFTATALQLAIGALALLTITAVTGTVNAFVRLPEIPWWHAIGGVASALYVLSTILLFPRLGAVVTVGLYVAGQMFASLALDGLGLLGSHGRCSDSPKSQVPSWCSSESVQLSPDSPRSKARRTASRARAW